MRCDGCDEDLAQGDLLKDREQMISKCGDKKFCYFCILERLGTSKEKVANLKERLKTDD